MIACLTFSKPKQYWFFKIWAKQVASNQNMNQTYYKQLCLWTTEKLWNVFLNIFVWVKLSQIMDNFQFLVTEEKCSIPQVCNFFCKVIIFFRFFIEYTLHIVFIRFWVSLFRNLDNVSTSRQMIWDWIKQNGKTEQQNWLKKLCFTSFFYLNLVFFYWAWDSHKQDFTTLKKTVLKIKNLHSSLRIRCINKYF